ncbi:MAG: hypothetical protein GXO66_06025 [Euryarchaeota archaeon]|nr:hypothetical protein [Euryarchaeota archaeon]
MNKRTINAVFALLFGMFVLSLLLSDSYPEFAKKLISIWYVAFLLIIAPLYLYLLATWRPGPG